MRPQISSPLTVWLWRAAFLGAAAVGAALPGCGGSSGPEPVAQSGTKTAEAAPVASISTSEKAPLQRPEPAAGTPEAILHAAKLLRTKPFSGVTSPEQIAEAHIDRHQEIVRMATEVLAKTHSDPEKSRTFDDAAFLLMNARLQLALCDDEKARDPNIDALYEHVEAFYKRDPKSKAAAEAAFTVAKFAHENARRHRSQEWLTEFSRQSQLFAAKFPQEDRASSLLYSAGWSCELSGLEAEAERCYTLIAEQYPDSEKAVAATGSLRRLDLVGKPVQLGGTTFDKGHVSVDEYAGKTVLVFFWQASNPKVAELMPILEELQTARGDELAIIGVALDEDEQTIASFLENHPLEWKQIFFSNPERRGWNNTVAEFYGVKSVPSLWLIGPDGKVRATNLTAETVHPAVTGRYGRMQLDVF